MTLVTRPAMVDDGGLFTTGTVVNKAFIDAAYDQIDDQVHSSTNPTVKPKAITDEVVTARGSKASLTARLDVSLAADGTLVAAFVNISGGLRVGFAGTTSADRIDLGDANLYLDFVAGGAGVPGIVFDANDSFRYDRTANEFNILVGAASKLRVSGTFVTLTVPIADEIQVGDANFKLDFAMADGNPGLVFDTAPYALAFDRSADTWMFEDSALGSNRSVLTIGIDGNVQFSRMGVVVAGVGGGVGVISIKNAGTNPTSNPTAGGILYSNAGAGTWRGSGGTVTAFGPAGPHCGKCGYDFWRVAAENDAWGASYRECGWCGAQYRRGPATVLDRLTPEQQGELVYA